ncbi:MAG: cytochrome c family protein [Dehalococcoidia bacterium]
MSGRARRLLLAVAGGVLLLLGVTGCADDNAHGPIEVPESADAAAGKRVIQSYGCGTCHRIPDVRGADGRVGPSLDGFGRQLYIAGAVPNNYENLIAWLMNPDAIEPGTIMPNFGMPEQTAADIAAYLATLR